MKIGNFKILSFCEKFSEKCVWECSIKKTSLSELQVVISEYLKKRNFPKALVKTWKILTSFFLAKTDQQNVFGNLLYGKQAFLDYKKVDFWMITKLEFFKGANQRFWSKIGHFANSFF